jgi:phosphoribosylglycinamide formyltransferase-1
MIASPQPIAIFASGAGSNAAKIIAFSQQMPDCPFRVAVVVCNKKGAGVATIAAANGIPVLWIEKERFFSGDAYLPELAEFGVDWIVLAGFLWKIPAALIAAYPQKIINIHPALLPNFGGKGMYGHFVHEAVIAAQATESGITIHFVDEQYDHGATIFQATCPVTPNDTPDSLAAKVHALEHLHFPRVVAEVVKGGEYRR